MRAEMIERQARASKWLLQRGQRAIQHGSNRDENVAYFTLKAEKAIKVRSSSAADSLDHANQCESLLS